MNYFDENLLIITVNTRIPYIFDIPLILGYPKSFRQRFRFKDKWLPHQVKAENFKTGQKGLIILRDENISANIFSESEEQSKPFHIPIRFFTLLEITKVDNMYFFDVALNEIVDFGLDVSSSEDRITRVKAFSLRLKKNDLPAIELDKDPNQHPFVYYVDNKAYNNFFADKNSANSEETNWGFLANLLIKFSQYGNIQFLKVISCSGDRRNKLIKITIEIINVFKDIRNWFRYQFSKQKLSKPVRYDNDGFTVSRNLMNYIYEKKGTFRLKANRTYFIDILQKLEHSEINKQKLELFNKTSINSVDDSKLQEINALPYEIHLSSKSGEISLPSSVKIAVGEYDRLRYLIKVRDTVRVSDTLLELSAFRKNEGSYNQPLFLPVVIRPRRLRKWLTVIVFAFGVAFSKIHEISPYLTGILNVHMNEQLLKVVEIIGIIVIYIMVGILLFRTDITKPD